MIKPPRFGVAIASILMEVIELLRLVVKDSLVLGSHLPGYMLVEMVFFVLRMKCYTGRRAILGCENGYDRLKAL